ncbi:MAG TPA: biotin synthase BioB [Candidatus Baltobacteraceae bacterium]|jgi:biotin synthase|nr:biotin synthase BioB [Candidatus Baltobacteraceae bacterium]
MLESATRPDTRRAEDPAIRHDWQVDELLAIYEAPLLDLVYRAAGVHRAYHDPHDIQRAALLSIKTGGCPEDCAYCPQSARYTTSVTPEPLLDVEEVLDAARQARDSGATRFCMGAAWRSVRNGPQFDAILEMVRGVRALGMEACTTLGMLTPEQANRLAEAGLTAYNHNLDSGPDFYSEIITTRRYDDRIATLDAVEAAGIGVCCGGILGMGESARDRVAMLAVLANRPHHPGSVPINALVPVEGTPLGEKERIDPLELVRTVATARIAIPKARVRLSAGRRELGRDAQILAFLAGANSIFMGETLLTTPNAKLREDEELFAALGLPS